MNEVYNLTLQNELENIEIVSIILEQLGLNFDETVEFVEDRLGHDFRYSIDNTKFLQISDVQPTSFQESLEQTIKGE
jgi:dTDP-glucose 4,6-dehydratase